MNYGYSKKVKIPFEMAVTKVKETLLVEGFGILTEIDVKATMKKKLDLDYDNYIILGACNPVFANKAFQAEKEIGLLLPCNVIVYDIEGDTYVSAIVPAVAMSMVENENLASLAKEVGEKLERAIDKV